ncbi:hypothetical protein [Hymenobacter crusticola]|uniref:Uncharacterized protein n=1 Tax=Hymenobacter crusticola TaxID=1770526 RepID=A0A243W5Z0_9BACT|nr:hypothetical protein [Hymenobacter crusticola]OUJ69073.1 hypothetical protein BXP70_27055 [Hymenobacter crusticola]
MISKEDFDPRTKSFIPKDYLPQDKGILVKDALKLIEHSPFADKLCELLGIDSIKDDFINIPGATMLVNSVDTESKHYLKLDITSDYLDLGFNKSYDEKSIEIKFSNLKDVSFPNSTLEAHSELLEEGSITAAPVYSSKSALFARLHSLSNYANELFKNGHGSLVIKNLELLRDIFSKEDSRLVQKYRLLKDKEDKYFLRGIVSNKYVDYNIGVSVFIALISLHKNILGSKDSYIISLCEYSESHIRVFFEKVGFEKVGNTCQVKHMIQLSNDELKREALKFSGIASILYKSGSETREIYLAPREIDYEIASIHHSYKPKKAIEKLELANDIKGIEKKLYNDISFIENIKEPDQIRHLLQKRVNGDTNLKPFIVGDIAKTLDEEIRTIHQLFDIMYKLDIVISDIDSKEYLRYLLYNMLKEEKNRRDNIKSKK